MNTEYEVHATKTKLLHLIYTDDLKLVDQMRNSSKNRCIRVRILSDGIHMEFRLDKCTETIFKKAKLVHLQNLILYVNKDIYEHEQEKTYHYHKYLWIEENEGIQCTKQGYSLFQNI
jgi:hypothetical protein